MTYREAKEKQIAALLKKNPRGLTPQAIGALLGWSNKVTWENVAAMERKGVLTVAGFEPTTTRARRVLVLTPKGAK
jgi:hypothetical protein